MGIREVAVLEGNDTEAKQLVNQPQAPSVALDADTVGTEPDVYWGDFVLADEGREVCWIPVAPNLAT